MDLGLGGFLIVFNRVASAIINAMAKETLTRGRIAIVDIFILGHK